jgi:hypothetical protein
MELVLCELYNPFLHGKRDYKKMYGHYLYICNNKDSDDDSDDDDDDDANAFDEMLISYRERYENLSNEYKRSPYIRNYSAIISKKEYIRPEIAQRIELPSGHVVVILKTFYLRLIQRAWKKVFKRRIQYYVLNMSKREARGKLYGLPTIAGMLSFLRR